jgi:hypothetical protein
MRATYAPQQLKTTSAATVELVGIQRLKMSITPCINSLGCEVSVFRDSDGWIVLAVDTIDIDSCKDKYENGIPKIRLQVNCSSEDLQEDGTWKRTNTY